MYSLVTLCVLANLASGFSTTSPFKTASPRINISTNQQRPSFLTTNNHRNQNRHTMQQRRKRNPTAKHASVTVRGGSTTTVDEKSSVSKVAHFTASLWAVGGLSYTLLKAVKRVLPVALEPFKSADAAIALVPLTRLQLGAYIVTCLFFAYAEGYKGFQRKFAPLVVARSLKIDLAWSKIHHVILGPFYAMGLFHATKKRMAVSWGVTIGVAAIVAVVKRLSYPYRSIVDAGVAVGLSWGTASILIGYVKALICGLPEDADPAFPEAKQ